MSLSTHERERYRRQMMLPGFSEAAQRRLKGATVLVTGVGGLGATAALYLAAAGVGRLVLARGGVLRLDDLNRQVLMTHDWVGKLRVDRARETLRAFNPDVEVVAVAEYVTADNAERLLAGADLALDCAHNFDERYLLNGACVRRGVPMVEAAMNGWEGYLTVVVPQATPCLACLYPEKSDWDRRGFGVLGAVSGTLACLAATEAIKLLTGLGRPLTRRLLSMDLADMTFNTFRVRRTPDCRVCGSPARREVRAG